MSGLAPYQERVRLASAAVEQAKASHVKHVEAEAANIREGQLLQARLQSLLADQDKVAVARALGEMTSVSQPDGEELADLNREIEASRRVEPNFKTRSGMAKERVEKAEAARNDAIRSFLLDEELDPARNEVMEALAQLESKASKLMALHYLAHSEFTNVFRHTWNIDQYGPAGQLFAMLRDDRRWSEGKYSIRPDWLPTCGPQVAAPGLKDALRYYRAKIEEISQ